MADNNLNQISNILDEKLAPIKSTLDQHSKILGQQGKILNQHSKILGQQGKILNQHSKILRSLKKDQNTILDVLDREQMEQRKRIKRIEEHLDLPTSI